MIKRSTVVVICLALLTGCVYRIDVQQGNEITADMIQQVTVGMDKREVVRVLGLPLINDPFNKDRWDYYYSFKSGKTRELIQESSTLIFENDRLASIHTRTQ